MLSIFSASVEIFPITFLASDVGDHNYGDAGQVFSVNFSLFEFDSLDFF